MARTTVVFACLLVLVALVSCARDWSRPPGQGVSISVAPTSASLGFGEALVFKTTVTRSSNDAVTWNASDGAITGAGETVTYTAPYVAGEHTVTVTSTSDPTQSATATVTVAETAIEEATFVATSGASVWTMPSGVSIGVESGVFTQPTPLHVAVYDASTRAPLQGTTTIGLKAVVSFDVDALSAFSDASIGLRVPPVASVGTATSVGRQTLLEIRIVLDDGHVFSTIRHYDADDTDWQSVTLGAALLRSVASELGVTGVMRIVAQPIDVTDVGSKTGVARASTTTGLYRIDSDAYSWSSLSASCPNSRNQVLPHWALAADTRAATGRQPIVLVHGWQVISNIFAEAMFWNRTTWRVWEEGYVPAICAWSHFIEHFHAEGLDTVYDLYTFGYASDGDVASSASRFSSALSLFGEEEVVVIAHSMGGMVANTHIKHSAARDEPSSVAALLTLGTPHAGSMAVVCLSTDHAGRCSSATVNPVVRDSFARAGNTLFERGALLIMSGALDVLQYTVTKHQGSRDLTWDREYTWLRPSWFFQADREMSSVPNEWLRYLNNDHPFQDYEAYTSFYGNIAWQESGDGIYDPLQSFGFEALGEFSDGIVTVESATLNWRLPTVQEYVGWNHSQIAGGGEPSERTDCTQTHSDPLLAKRCTVFSDITQWLTETSAGGQEPSITITPAGIANAEIGVSYSFDFTVSGVPRSVTEVVFEWSFGDGGAVGSTGSSGDTLLIDSVASTTASYAYRAVGAYGLVVAVRDANTGAVLAQRAATITVGESLEREYDLSVCDTWRAATQGGQGVTTDTWDIRAIPPGAVFDIRYDAIRQPDRFFVEYPVGNQVLDTGWRGSQGGYDRNPDLYPGGLAGPGAGEEFDMFVRIASIDSFLVTVVGPEPGTLWDYEIRCRYVGP